MYARQGITDMAVLLADLAAGNWDWPNRVYENTGTGLLTTASWTSFTHSVSISS